VLRYQNPVCMTGVNLAAGLDFIAARKPATSFERYARRYGYDGRRQLKKVELDPEGPGSSIDRDEDNIDNLRAK